jgi:hypothetical protein
MSMKLIVKGLKGRTIPRLLPFAPSVPNIDLDLSEPVDDFEVIRCRLPSGISSALRGTEPTSQQLMVSSN